MLANYKAVTGQAQQVAATPYQAFGGQLVSPINSQQSAGINAVNDASGIQNPFNAGATGLAAASSANINPAQFSGAALQQFENPYQNDVVNSTLAEINNQNGQQSAALTGSAIGAGAFGGDRAGVAQAALAGQQDIAKNATLAGLNSQNFTNAVGEFNTQQSLGLSAGQNTAARQLAASQQIGNLGQTAQQEALTGANAQVNAGTLQQTTQQAQDTAAYNQFLQEQAYPFQTTGWLANIVEGIGSQSGGTSTGQQTQTGSTAGGIAGGLLSLGSMFINRGGRVTGERPHKAYGGGLVSPYAAVDPAQGLGAGSYVTPANLQVGHTMPSGQMPGMAPSGGGQDMAAAAKGVQGLGKAFNNSALGDKFNDFMQDTGDNLFGDGSLPMSPTDIGLGGDMGLASGLYARGGLVRRHYDDGGVIGADWDDSHGYAPALQPNDVAAANPLAAAATIPTPEAAMAARYANGNMPAPQQDGFTPQQRLAVAMGAPQPQSGDTPPPSTPPTPEGLAKAADTTSPAALDKLRVAMGGSNTPPDPNAVYGGLGDVSGLGPIAANAPQPPPRPAGLGAAPQTLDAAAPGGLGVATAGAPMQLPGGGLAAKVPTWADVQADNAQGDADIAARTSGFDPDRAATAIKSVESGGNYAAVGPATDSGDHAYGAYQVMGANIPAWTAKWAGKAMTPAEFIKNPAAQDAVFKGQFGTYVQQYGGPTNAASAWFTGRPLNAATAGLKDQLGTSDNAYVNKFMAAYSDAPNVAPAAQAIAGATGRGAPQPGLTAGNYSAPGLAAGTPPLTADSPVASTDARPDTGGGLLGLHLSPEARQGLLAAGLGMMAGTSRSGLVNIGQGGLQGLAAYNNARNLQSEIDLRRAQAERQMVETGLLPVKTASEIAEQQARTGLFGGQAAGADAEAKIKEQRLKLLLKAAGDIETEGAKKADAVAAATAPASAAATATPSPATGRSAPGAPTDTAAASTSRPVVAGDDPQKLEARANALALAGETSAAEILTNRAKDIREGRRQVSFTDGGPDDYYGNVMQGKNQQVTNAANAAELAKVPAGTMADMQKAQVAARTRILDEANNALAVKNQAIAMRNVLFDPKTGAPTVSSGPLGPMATKLAATLQQMGVPPRIVNALSDPNAAQELQKLASTSAAEIAHMETAGAPLRVSTFTTMLKSLPNDQMLPGAMKYLIDNVIIPKSDQQAGVWDAVKDMHPERGDDIQAKEYEYNRTHGFATAGVNAPAASAIPPAAQRVVNQTYPTPKGPMTWVGNGWRPAAASP